MHLPFDIDLPPQILLHTTNLTCIYGQGALRYIRCGNTEIIRMIYSAVRDKNWGTVGYNISDEHIQQEENSFTVTYTARYRQDDIAYEAVYRIEGRKDDSIVFEMNGKAVSTFNTNRTGLCIHLPVKECADMPVTVIHPSGEQTITSFPDEISPHQPFTQIDQLHWKTADEFAVRVIFSGEVFEAEDQRNWMDHSFKVYGRPLDLPFPFEVKAGDTMQQAIRVQVVSTESIMEDTVPVSDEKPVPLPALGIAAADEPVRLTGEEIGLLQALPFQHYRAELDFEKDWQCIWEIHCHNAKALDMGLELVLFFTDDYASEAESFLNTLPDSHCSVRSILPQHKTHKVTPSFLQEFFYPLVKQQFPGIQVGYGTDIYFTELNRQRPQNDLFDFVSFSLNPQVHSFDAQTILENTDTITDMIRTVRSFTDKPVFISPVTFKKRKNHDGTGDTRHDLVNNFDARQHTGFGAGWFLLCLSRLENVQQVSFFKTKGNSGIISNKGETPPTSFVLQQLKLFSPVTMIKKGNSIIFKNKQGEDLVFSLDDRFAPTGL